MPLDQEELFGFARNHAALASRIFASAGLITALPESKWISRNSEMASYLTGAGRHAPPEPAWAPPERPAP